MYLVFTIGMYYFYKRKRKEEIVEIVKLLKYGLI